MFDTRYKFTSKELDNETSYMYFEASSSSPIKTTSVLKTHL